MITDGREVHDELTRTVDVVVVGSGPGGAAVSRVLARAGLSTLIVEAGRPWAPDELGRDGFTAMADLYVELGAALSAGRAPLPLVQGRAVGGTSVINGAICWRLPRDVHQRWIDADPALEETLPWDQFDATTDAIEERLNVAPTNKEISGPNNDLLAVGAEALGLEHRPIRRNVRDCEGLGQCLQGCPRGHKLAMDRSLIPDALDAGAELLHSTEIAQITTHRGRATGVVGTTEGGGRVRITADRVVLCAGAVQTPALLLKSRIRSGPIGHGFMAHPGVSMSGHFKQPVRMWTGATQGHEVTGLRHEGLKFEAMGYDMALVAARLKGAGTALSQGLDQLAHQAQWGAAIKASAQGRVVRWPLLGTRVRYDLTREDMVKARRAVRILGEMMLAAGAEHVTPGVHGFDPVVTDPSRMTAIEEDGSLDPRDYLFAATHLFASCRMGSDPATSVIGSDFQCHGLDGLYVTDASAFPSNTGVNPQIAICVMATLAGEQMSA